MLPVKYNLQTAFLSNDPCWDYWKHESEMKMGIEDPIIVHFTSKWKPWFADLRFPHPYRSTFLKYQCQTKWKNCSCDRRPLYMKIRNCIGDVLRKIGVMKQVDSNFLDVLPID
jgi:lipopolysaccharide biosynthesis glycosyltransferase